MKAALALAAVVFLAAAPQASAQARNAPPGNSGIDEYLETVPAADGNRPTGSNTAKPRPLPSAALREARGSGREGAELAAVARATAPPAEAAPPARRRSAEPVRATDPEPAATPVRSPLSAATDAVGGAGPGGMGPVLPALLIATTLGAVAVILRRRLAG